MDNQDIVELTNVAPGGDPGPREDLAPQPLADASILSFSLDQWTDIWRGRHHLLTRFAQTNKVLHVTPQIYIGHVLDHLTASKGVVTGTTKINENLYWYAPPWWLPQSFRLPSVDRIVTGALNSRIRATMRRAGLTNPILYIWHPQMVDVIDRFDSRLIVYHCYDEYLSFHMEDEARDKLSRQERRLLERANVVFAASEELLERRRKFNPNVHLVRNGVDYSLFARAQDNTTRVPRDLVALPRPVIGCVATQMLMIDLPLIREIFTRRPDWSLVFIGIDRVPDQAADAELRAVQKLPNVHFVGRRPIEEIPGYLKGCDVCTIPWILNDISLVSSSPLKMYEYLAAGKPVVSKPLPLISGLKSIFSFATSADEWVSSIEHALSENTVEQVELRQEAARRNTWDQRADLILRTLAKQFD